MFLQLLADFFSLLTVILALAPWFEPGSKWGGGGYLAVDKNVGSLVDWYNVQFYNRKIYRSGPVFMLT